MATTQVVRHTARVGGQPFVIVHEENGYHVYSPLDPKDVSVVSGLPELPQCSCRAFRENAEDPEFLCPHLEAVLEAANGNGSPAGSSPSFAGVPSANGRSMVLKRSVSPDGRIDSLSVEFAIPLADLTSKEIKDRASSAISLQAAIVTGFLNSGGNGGGLRESSRGNGAVPAQMLGIEATQTRRGPCLCLGFDVNGRRMKVFGDRNRLGNVLSYAGYPHLAGQVAHGMVLNLPCRVTLKPSPDGRYQHVDRVYPDAGGTSSQR